MHDDDDPDPAPEPRGRLIRSGFANAHERADYALPHGEAALHGTGPEFDTEASRGDVSRRLLLGLGVAGFGAGITSLVWNLVGSSGAQGGTTPTPEADGRSSSPASASARSPSESQESPSVLGRRLVLVRGARAMADGSIDELVRAHLTYIQVVETHGDGDELLWRGMRRLGEYALLDGGALGQGIARRLLQAFRFAPAPLGMEELRRRLDDLVSSREREQERQRERESGRPTGRPTGREPGRERREAK